MEKSELEKLKAVLPKYMVLRQNVRGYWEVYSEHEEEAFTLLNQSSAEQAIDHLLCCHASMGRKAERRDAEKRMRDALGLTAALNDIHTRIGRLNTRLVAIEEKIGETPDAVVPDAPHRHGSGVTGASADAAPGVMDVHVMD